MSLPVSVILKHLIAEKGVFIFILKLGLTIYRDLRFVIQNRFAFFVIKENGEVYIMSFTIFNFSVLPMNLVLKGLCSYHTTFHRNKHLYAREK